MNQEWKLVPARMWLDKATIGAIYFHCGDGAAIDLEECSEGELWIGAVTDDDGKEVYGLHIMTAEYPEEGSTTLVEFAEPVPPAGGEPGAVEGLRQLAIGPYPDPDVEDAHDEYLDEHQSQALWLLRNAGRIETHVTRLQAENAALQQRLNVADEQVDILSGGLRLMTSFGSGTNIAGVKTVAKQTLNRAAGVALKADQATPQ